MGHLRGAVGFLGLWLVLAASPAANYAQAGEAPLTITVLAAKELLVTFGSEDHLKKEFDEVFSGANLTFKKEIGRELRLKSFEMIPSPPDSQDRIFTLVHETRTWLEALMAQRDFNSDIVIFLTPYPLLDNELESRPEYEGLRLGRLLIVHYNANEINFFKTRIILHEIGHFCGVGGGDDHSSDPNSIMYKEITPATSYRDKIEVIKKYCGQERSP